MASLLSQQLCAALGEPSLPDVSKAAAGNEHGSGREDSDAGVMTCSICLQHTDLEQIASLKGCDHTYCVKCILRWAAHREHATCPQCKAPFSTLSTYLQLDGTLCDFPCEESVVLLLRAPWFTEHMQVVDNGKAWRLSADDSAAGFGDYDAYYREYDDDEEVEDYYFSAAAGRARIVLGNRRLGENGFIASGRRQARPAAQASVGRKKKGGAATAPPPSTQKWSEEGRCKQGGSGGRRRRSKGQTPDPQADPAAAFRTDGAASASANPPATTDAAAAASDNAVIALLSDSTPGSSASATQPPPAAMCAPCPAVHRARAGASATPGRAIPQRSNRRPGGTPGSSTYRASAAASSADAAWDEGSHEIQPGSSPLGSSPGSCSSGRRARRATRRALEDQMAALRVT